jgi:DNA-binding transcriptional regulator YhcF (GntR family)
MTETKLTYKVRLKGTEDWATVNKDQFNSLSLEDGARMPEMQGNKVITTNYFNTYWGRIMGARNFRVFMVLSQFAYGNKDFSYPSLQTLADICDMSPNTVKTAIKELEELGFVIQVQVLDENEENQNNIYIIRKTTPFLSIEQFQSLPKRMQDSHKKYIANIEESERISLSNAPDYPQPKKSDTGGSKSKGGGSKFDTPPSNKEVPVDNVDIGDNVDKNSQKGGSNFDTPLSEIEVHQNLTDRGSKIDTGVGQNLTPNKYNLLSTTELNKINNNITIFKTEFFEFLRIKISKPSFDTWIRPLDVQGFDTDRMILTLRAEHQMQKEWVESRYIKPMQEVLRENFNLPDIKINVAFTEPRH